MLKRGPSSSNPLPLPLPLLELALPAEGTLQGEEWDSREEGGAELPPPPNILSPLCHVSWHTCLLSAERGKGGEGECAFFSILLEATTRPGSAGKHVLGLQPL